MIAQEHTIPTASQFELPAIDVRAVCRRVALPALIAGVAVAAVLLGAGRVHAFADGIRRGLGLSPGWAATGVLFEFLSIAGYVALLSLVAGRATPRVGTRESAQMTLAGAAATRLVPTAGAGGVAVTLWALRRAGLRSREATGTLLVFMIVLYSVFLTGIVLSGTIVALGLMGSHGPGAVGAAAAAAATVAIAGCGVLVARRRPGAARGHAPADADWRTRLRSGAGLAGDAASDAWRLVRACDPRLAGALAYWAFDAAVVWATLHAFGAQAAVPVVVLAYFVGQVANTIPLPGSVSGGMVGVLAAFGVPVELALPSVLAYRAISVWIPAPVAIAAVPALRSTINRWGREEAATSAAA